MERRIWCNSIRSFVLIFMSSLLLVACGGGGGGGGPTNDATIAITGSSGVTLDAIPDEFITRVGTRTLVDPVTVASLTLSVTRIVLT
ncbi:MAG TPA: hypothetical protein EYQ00_04210, partial [Dehalococcoidia bacterium]|nr:hypothetical protein [Dehalococcoidia bacterium]